MLERFPNDSLVSPNQFENPYGASYKMLVQDQVMRPNAYSASMTLTLPIVAESKGKWYSIILTNTTGGHTCTVIDQGDSEDWHGAIVLNAAHDRLLLFSDGRTWIPFFSATNSPS
jgi:hypothetical protein